MEKVTNNNLLYSFDNYTYYILTSQIPQGTTFVTSTDYFLRDGYIAQLATITGQYLFKSLDKVPKIDALINCESEKDVWDDKKDAVNHQLLPIPN